MRIACAFDHAGVPQHALDVGDADEYPQSAHVVVTAIRDGHAARDFEVLATRGRRALRIDVGDDPAAGLAVLHTSIGRALQSIAGTRGEQRR